MNQVAQKFLLEGESALKRGARAEAEAAYLQALANDPDCLHAHVQLSHIRLPGTNYLDIISCIHDTLRPATYVEIGVETGRSIVRAHPTTRCIGIDPMPQVQVQLSPDTTIYAATSDEFFTECDLRELLGGKSVALGFVDGLHLFENALMDFANLEKYCAPDSVVMFHDCLPLNAATATRERQTSFWTGDTWRVLPTLAHFRPDLSITVIGAPPSGLAVVRGLDPTSHVLNEKWDEVQAYALSLDFSTTKNLPALGIEILPSEPSVVARMFAEAPSRKQ